MNGIAVLLVTASLGVDYGWRKLDDGKVEYIVQLAPAQIEQLKNGAAILSVIPPELRGVRLDQIRIQAGTGKLPKDPRIQPPPGLKSQLNASENAITAPIAGAVAGAAKAVGDSTGAAIRKAGDGVAGQVNSATNAALSGQSNTGTGTGVTIGGSQGSGQADSGYRLNTGQSKQNGTTSGTYRLGGGSTQYQPPGSTAGANTGGASTNVGGAKADDGFRPRATTNSGNPALTPPVQNQPGGGSFQLKSGAAANPAAAAAPMPGATVNVGGQQPVVGSNIRVRADDSQTLDPPKLSQPGLSNDRTARRSTLAPLSPSSTDGRPSPVPDNRREVETPAPKRSPWLPPPTSNKEASTTLPVGQPLSTAPREIHDSAVQPAGGVPVADAGAAAQQAPVITQLEKPVLEEDPPWGTLLLALFALALSAVGNVYLGLSFYGLHQRYRDLLHRVHVPEVA